MHFVTSGDGRFFHRRFLFAALSLLVFFFCDTAFAAAVFRNEMTPQHVVVPGVDAYFSLPQGMKQSDRFDGFVSEARAIEVIVADIKSPYETIRQAFTKETLATRGMEMMSQGDVEINGEPGLLIKALHLDGDNRWGKWILLLSAGDSTLVVNGIFANGDAAAAKDVEMMLKSVIIRKEPSGQSFMAPEGEAEKS